MTGRIIRLVDHEQIGAISAEDGADYVFHASALNHGAFKDLLLGTPVSFEPITSQGARRATLVRVLRK
jgi:cold shock CspA family protein